MSEKKITIRSNKSIEDSPFYVPAFFLLMLAGLLILFGDFLFSHNMMLYGSDTIETELFHRTTFVDYFKSVGSIPQWDPSTYGGMPYVDSFQGDTFYPLSVLKFFIPMYYVLGLNLVIHIFLAGIFMFLAAREFELGKTASLFSAASYMFAASLVSLIASGHDGNISIAALFPLVMLLLHRGFRSKPFLNFTLLGLILGMIILSPHPRLSYFTLWAVALYSIYRLISLIIARKRFTETLKPALLLLYALILALSLSAIQFYPGYYYTSHYSVRAEKEGDWAWATSWSLHEEDVLSQLIPEFSGFTSELDGDNYYWGKNAFKDSTETIGVVPIFLAIIGLLFSRRKDSYFFAGLALFSFVYALGATTPIFKLFYYYIPKVNSLRAPAMIMFIFSFSVALLSGMGIQTILNWKRSGNYNPGKSFYVIIASLPILMLVLAALFTSSGYKMITLWTSLFFQNAAEWKLQSGMTKFDIALLNLPAVKNGAWIAFVYTAVSAILVWVYLRVKAYELLLSALVLIPILDGVRFNARFVSVLSPDNLLNNNNVVRYLNDQPGKYRVFNYKTKFPTTMLTLYGIEIVDVFHRNKMLSFDELFWGKDGGNWANPRFLNLIGTRYLLMPTGHEIPDNYFGPLPIVTERKSRYLAILRNDNALSRVFLTNAYEISDDEKISLEVLFGHTDLRQIVYLDQPPEIEIPLVELNADSAWIISHAYDSVLVGVHCSSNRLLVLTENDYDAWHAYIDGAPARILKAYSTFRVVAVPAGAKEVLFRYKSERYELGKKITVVTSIWLLAVFGVYAWEAKSRKFGKLSASAGIK